MSDRRPRMELADYVRELTEWHPHVEHYDLSDRDIDGKPIPRVGPPGRNHVRRVPALIDQLWANDIPSNTAETGTRPGFASKPAARLDTLDAAVRIDIEANRWVTDLGEQARTTDTAAVIRQLHGLTPSADAVTRSAVLHDVRRWWTQARIVTGWDSPAWTPMATCPQCGQLGSLKIRLGEHIGMCTNDACRVTWDESTIGLLADHIRAETAEKRRAPGRGPCWCPWPMPRVPDLRLLCRRCGSARCRHALTARLLQDVAAARHAGRGDVA